MLSWLFPDRRKVFFKTFLFVNLGVFFLSFGVYFFKFPNNFSTGGVSGIAVLFGRILPQLTPATLMSMVNLGLLLIGFIFLGTKFGFWTTYCSLMFSLETWLMERLYPMEAPFTDQPFLELCFAILLPAVGSALMFSCNASSGGTDIVAMILRKYTHLDIGKSLLITDFIIAFSACFVFNIKTGLFSILGLFLKAFVVDLVIESINLCKYFSIVTTKSEEISNYIIHQLNHSATVVDAYGAYTGTEKKVVMTACRRGEAIKLQRRIKELDPSAFLFITNTSEIIGKGFRNT